MVADEVVICIRPDFVPFVAFCLCFHGSAFNCYAVTLLTTASLILGSPRKRYSAQAFFYLLLLPRHFKSADVDILMPSNPTAPVSSGQLQNEMRV